MQFLKEDYSQQGFRVLTLKGAFGEQFEAVTGACGDAFEKVWFKLRTGGAICLPRITQPEPAQAILVHQLGWNLPEQPPPRIYQHQVPDVWTT
jgi:hypothetical protein